LRYVAVAAAAIYDRRNLTMLAAISLGDVTSPLQTLAAKDSAFATVPSTLTAPVAKRNWPSVG